MRDGLRLALTTLTVVPVRRDAPLDRRTAGRAMELAPLLGLVLGLLAGGLAHLVRWAGGGDLLAAVLAVATLAVLTRGLHLDGLADVADGLASYRDPEGTRAVMKGPEVGPLGVVTLVLVVLLQVTALQACFRHHIGTVALVVAICTSRIALTAACRGTPAALPTGLGALVAGTVRRGVTSVWVALAVVALGQAAATDGDARGTAATRFGVVALTVAVGLLGARLLRAHVTRRVGGLTGDVLGALSEAATTICLVVLAVGT